MLLCKICVFITRERYKTTVQKQTQNNSTNVVWCFELPDGFYSMSDI